MKFVTTSIRLNKMFKKLEGELNGWRVVMKGSIYETSAVVCL